MESREFQGFGSVLPHARVGSVLPRGRVGSAFPRGRVGWAAAWVVLAVVVLAVGWQFFEWFLCRIEIEPGKVGILISKMGKNLPSGEIIAPDDSFKGIQLRMLPEGRHFYNPFFYDWEIHDSVEVPTNNVGVLFRYYGRDFTASETREGKIIADEGQKGISSKVLTTGRYRINPYAEGVKSFPFVAVPAGSVGVVTNLSGREPRAANTFLVEDDEKGVSKKVLQPGNHPIHPFMQSVTIMDVRSHRFELTGEGALKFPSSDAFEMTVLLTVEWAIDPLRAPEIFVRIGELHDDNEKNEILQKVLIPAIRGYGRIEGSKYAALDYFAGNSRTAFQNSLFEKLKEACESKGIFVKSVLINDIEPPQEIAKPIRDREIYKEELSRNKSQLLQAQAEQSLARSQEMVGQEKEKVEAKTKNLVKIIDAQNRQKVALINQERRLMMEKTLLESARKEAEAILTRGKAKAEVIMFQANAEADALRKSVEAFKNPSTLAYYEFLMQVAPAITDIFANTEGGFGRVFSGLLPEAPRKGGKGE